MTSSLSAEQLTELRVDLEHELVRLRRSMIGTAEAARPVTLDQTSVGRVSRIDAITNQSMQKGLHEREQTLELALVEALERIAHGTYGRCAKCEQPIPYGRLLAMPEARQCAACGGG